MNIIGKLMVKIGAVTDDLEKGMKRSEVLVTKTSSKLGGLSRIASGAVDKIRSKVQGLTSTLSQMATIAGGILLSKGIEKLGSGLISVGRAGFDMNSAMETVLAQLQAFTKDGSKSAQILEMIRDRAAKTPFAFMEMAQSVTSLLPAAKASGQNLEELISLSEVLAASNPMEGLEGAAFSLKEALGGDFVSIVERFNLPRQYINKLKEEGVPALEIVRQAMAKLGLDTDLVANLAQTARGRWSTFTDTLRNYASLITQPFFDAFSGGLAKVNEFLAENGKWIESIASSAGSILQNLINKTTEWLGQFTGGDFGIVLQGWAGFFNLLEQGQATWSLFGSELGFTLDKLLGTGTQLANTFSQFFGQLSQAFSEGGVGAVFQLLFETVTAKLGELGVWIFEQVQVYAGNFWSWVQGENGVTTQVGAILGGLIETINQFLVISWPKIRGKLTEWSDKFWGWVLGTDGQPGVIQKTDDALIALSDSILDWIESNRDKLAELGNKGGEALGEGLKLYFENQDKINGLINALLATIIRSVGSLHTALAETGAELGTGLVDGLIKSLNGSELNSKLQNAIRFMIRNALDVSGIRGITTSMKRLGLPGFASGGIVPGPVGRPMLAVVHGQEEINRPGERKIDRRQITDNRQWQLINNYNGGSGRGSTMLDLNTMGVFSR